jgi:dienelactone hydrolase
VTSILHYCYPARNAPYCTDLKGSMQYLEDPYGLVTFVPVGWSFGGTPVFTMADEDEKAAGCDGG